MEYTHDTQCQGCTLFFMTKDVRLKDSEIFAIECGELWGMEGKEVSLLYSPMRQDVALIDSDTLEAVTRYAQDQDKEAAAEVKDLWESMFHAPVWEVEKRDVMLSESMSILPNLTCNFACSYCYSAQGRSATVMPWEVAQRGLDLFIDKERAAGKPLRLFISGGGEPLVSWPLTRRIVEYARERAKEQGLKLSIGLITNGSLITSDICEVLRDTDCTVGVSFEVLEDLQTLQRKMWHRVSQNIHLLHQRGVRVKMNSTITPASVGRMEEMLRTVAREYPYVEAYTMEPVTSVDLFATREELRAFYDQFFEQYVRCSQVAKEMGVSLRFTFDDAMRGITPRHCPGKLCLTPTGKLSACHLVSSPREERFEECTYGMVSPEGVEIDREKFEALYATNVTSYERCRDCFAKWDCGGECMTRNALYPKEYMEEVCRFNRRFVLHALLRRVSETIGQEYNMTLDEYVGS